VSRPLKNALLEHVVRVAKDAVVVADARREDMPIIYVNPAFEQMTGYAAADVLGRNCRFLQGEDRRQRALRDVREALASGGSCEVLLRNYRQDGTMFWNQLSLSPVRDRGRLTWYVGICRDVGALRDMKDRLRNRQRALRQARSQAPDDRLTGLRSRAYLDRMLEHEWSACVREGRRLTVFLFGVDHFERYSETFGRRAADSCLRRLAQSIRASFRRGSDVCARYDETRIACFAVDGEAGRVLEFATQICRRIRELCIHHPKSPSGRYVTVSAGVATIEPGPDDSLETLLELVEARLGEAGSAGGDQANGG
jgi:diguanylate cyclase (GGDEF)-like protein